MNAKSFNIILCPNYFCKLRSVIFSRSNIHTFCLFTIDFCRHIQVKLIVKNLLISLCGYEIEMRGIQEKYVKEITTLVWGFIWGRGINQIDRKVCCLGVPYLIILYIITMMNAKSFNIILCPNYFCKLRSVIFSRSNIHTFCLFIIGSACLQMTLGYLIKMMNLSKNLLIF
jgi:hypothetical protein